MDTSTQAETYRGADGAMRRVFRAGPNDRSPINLTYASECGLCHLGFTHSTELHAARVAEGR